jgi:hypothetical protein
MARQRDGGWFLLGLLLGAAVGAAVRLVLDSGTATARGTGGDPMSRVRSVLAAAGQQAQGTLQRAQAAFEQGRASALGAGHAMRETTEEATDAALAGAAHTQVTPAERVTAVTTGLTGSVQGVIEQVKSRWREAIAEGKQAAAETEADLRRRYLEDTKRV